MLEQFREHRIPAITRYILSKRLQELPHLIFKYQVAWHSKQLLDALLQASYPSHHIDSKILQIS